MGQGLFRAWQPTAFHIRVSFLPLPLSPPAFCFLLYSFTQGDAPWVMSSVCWTRRSQRLNSPLHWREKKVHVHANTCTWTFPAALFVIAANWKLPNSPINRWMDKQIVVYTCNGKQLRNKKELWICATMCMNLKMITPSERSQMRNSITVTFYKILKNASSSRGVGVQRGMYNKGAQGECQGCWLCPYLDCGDGFRGVYVGQNSSHCSLQHVRFIVCQLYLYKAV